MTNTEATWLESATDVAEIVTVDMLVPLAGAVYRPELEMVPIALGPPLLKSVKVQVTPMLLVFCSVAVNCCVPPKVTTGETGETEIATGGMMVTVAEADFVGSATEMAVTVTGLALGSCVGGEYSPPEVIIPLAELPPAIPFTSQVTAKFVVFVTVARNC